MVPARSKDGRQARQHVCDIRSVTLSLQHRTADVLVLHSISVARAVRAWVRAAVNVQCHTPRRPRAHIRPEYTVAVGRLTSRKCHHAISTIRRLPLLRLLSHWCASRVGRHHALWRQGHCGRRVHGDGEGVLRPPDSGAGQRQGECNHHTRRRRREQSVPHSRRRRSRRNLDLQPGTEHAHGEHPVRRWEGRRNHDTPRIRSLEAVCTKRRWSIDTACSRQLDCRLIARLGRYKVTPVHVRMPTKDRLLGFGDCTEDFLISRSPESHWR